MIHRPDNSRSGVVLVLLLVAVVTLFAFVALAIDLGMLAVARTQLQDAVDIAAMAGTRTLNGDMSANNNYAAAAPNAIIAATANSVLAKPIEAGQVSVDIGRYVYMPGPKRFEGRFPGPANENWSMVMATVTANVTNNMAFARIFNLGTTNMQAESVAVHRPRDVAVVLDFSGSMRYGSTLGLPFANGARTSSNNPDPVFPAFGHYASANFQAASSPAPYGPANISTTTADGRAPVIYDFYRDGFGGAAFSEAPVAYKTAPGGDNCLRRLKNSSVQPYAATLQEIITVPAAPTGWTASTADLRYGANKSNWKSTANNGAHINLANGKVNYNIYAPDDVAGSRFNKFGSASGTSGEVVGYQAFSGAAHAGYTHGPGHWGKTFFVWPPDPLNDWRVKYFNTNDNTKLWDSSGNWRVPSGSTYTINYTAILSFIKNVGPSVFPNRLQSGRILYYDAIPNSISSSWPPSNDNERFWRDYINYALGLVQYGASSYELIGDRVGYGDDDTWGTVQITPPPLQTLTTLRTNNSITDAQLVSMGLKTTTNGPIIAANVPYMDYRDNPKRPRTRFWFGSLTMVDFLGNYNMWYHSRVTPVTSRYCWWPGTCHESPMYACKLGIRAALNDIETNHPNNLVALIMFSHPRSSATADGRFNRPRVGLGRNYTRMQEALWYPPSTLGNSGAAIRPYDDENWEVPRAVGGTCYAMGLMQAYNQFSANTSLLDFNPSEPSGDAGGNGRRGAQKVVIFETDGMPTHTATATLTNNGMQNSYYRIRFKSGGTSGSEFPTVSQYTENNSTVTSQIYSLCNQLVASESASPPGYSTPNKKALIHCIGFGPVFAPGSPNRAAAIATLNQMQSIGNVSDGMPDYKIIYGSEQEMVNRMQQAFTQILQSGVQVSLLH